MIPLINWKPFINMKALFIELGRVLKDIALELVHELRLYISRVWRG